MEKVATALGLVLNGIGAGVLAWNQSAFGKAMLDALRVEPSRGATIQVFRGLENPPLIVQYNESITVIGWGLIALGLLVQLLSVILGRSR